MKIVINVNFGGFGLSDAAYEKLIEWGIPVRKYIEQDRGPDGLYKPQALNDGEVIFDRDLDQPDELHRARRMSGRYWDCWTNGARSHPLIVRVVEELGTSANAEYAALRVVEIPDGLEWEIDEYHGKETVRYIGIGTKN